MFATICSILVLLWVGSSIAQRSGGWAESEGLLLLARQFNPLPFSRVNVNFVKKIHVNNVINKVGNRLGG